MVRLFSLFVKVMVQTGRDIGMELGGPWWSMSPKRVGLCFTCAWILPSISPCMDFSKNLRIKCNPFMKMIATQWSMAVVLNQGWLCALFLQMWVRSGDILTIEERCSWHLVGTGPGCCKMFSNIEGHPHRKGLFHPKCKAKIKKPWSPINQEPGKKKEIASSPAHICF